MSEATFTRWVDPTIEEKDKEIERLNNKNKQWENKTKILETDRNNWESKFYEEAKKVDKAIEIIKDYLCTYDYTNAEFKNIAPVFMDLLNTFEGEDKE